MDQPHRKPLDVLDTSLETVEEFNLWIQNTGWDSRFRQLDLGAKQVQLKACGDTGLSILRVYFPNRLHQQAATPTDSLTFGIPACRQPAVRFGPSLVPSESITCFGDSMDVVSDSGFSAFTLSAHKLSLENAICALEPGNGPEMNFQAESRNLTPALATGIRQALDELLQNALRPDLSGSVKQQLLENFAMQLPAILVNLWSKGDLKSNNDNRGREQDVVRRSLEYLTSDRLSRCRIEDVCDAACSSQRSLERAFRRRFHITPKQYITRLRLSAVHRCLLDEESSESVGDIATNWGFWHLSQFAASYRDMFAELPSETIRRVRPQQLQEP